MEVVYKIKTKELDIKIIEAIKKMFVDDEVIISIISSKNINEQKHYSPQIINALENFEKGNFKDLSENEFEKYYPTKI